MEWKPFWDGVYEVSEYGHVARIVPAKGGRTGHILRHHLHKPGPSGRPTIKLRHNNVVRRFYIATLVAEVFLGPRPKGITINHKDGNKLNNHHTNLEYISMRENFSKAVTLHLHRHGEDHPCVKLTESQVKEIWQRFKNGERQKDLAETFGVNKSTLQALFKGKTWKHLHLR